MLKKFAKWLAVLLTICLMLTACTPAETAGGSGEDTYSQEVQNLEKLCLVWGYAKYRHPSFYDGSKDWDEELDRLFPRVKEAENGEGLNELLYDWFVSLGEVSSSSNRNQRSWENRDTRSVAVQADLSWIRDTSYLGEELSAALQQIEVMPQLSKKSAGPVSASSMNGNFVVSFNEKEFENFDSADPQERLCSLFRIWNAVEYYSPYLEYLDTSWHNLLPKYIERMLAAKDELSYQLTLCALVAELHDLHAFVSGYRSVLKQVYGEYIAPVLLATVEEKPVVVAVMEKDCSLALGDIVLKLDGRAIEEVIQERLEYVPTSMEDKLYDSVYEMLLSSQDRTMEVTVLRDGVEQTLSVEGSTEDYVYKPEGEESYRILEGNIGLLNPSNISETTETKNKEDGINEIMEQLADTEGLIIDMRQYPDNYAAFFWLQSHYLMKEGSVTALQVGRTVDYYPGAYRFEDFLTGSKLEGFEGSYSDRPVVVLMDEGSRSKQEYFIMFFSTNENVTLMGETTGGVDGDMRWILMPDGKNIYFSALGIYGPNREQVQRTGIAPDIEVKRTIEGIKEGRDELMEAAIAYIQEQSQSATVAE